MDPSSSSMCFIIPGVVSIWNRCTRCGDTLYSVVTLITILCIFIIGLAFYAYMIARHARSTKWVTSSIAIFVTHLQTIEIISKLRVAWPESTRKVVASTHHTSHLLVSAW